MKIKYLYIILLSVFVFFSPMNSLYSRAEDLFSTSTEVPKQTQFDSIKSEISQLIEENKKLEVEYSLIYKEFESLASQIVERQKEVQNLKQNIGIDPDRLDDQASNIKEPAGDPNEILVLDSRLNLLKTRLGNLEDQNNARKMQIEALKYQKGELEIEVKMKNYLLTENDKKNSNNLESLKADLQKIQDEEEKAVNRIAELQEEKQNYPQRIAELQRANKELQEKIADLEKKKELKMRESANLKDKKLLEELLAERAMKVKQEEKDKLETALRNFQSEYNKLDQQVSQSLQSSGQSREMLKSLIQVDKENQDLRDRISALKDKLSKVNR